MHTQILPLVAKYVVLGAVADNKYTSLIRVLLSFIPITCAATCSTLYLYLCSIQSVHISPLSTRPLYQYRN